MTAITLNLDDRSRALIDDWVREGHYGSAEEVVQAGIAFVREQVEALDWTPSAADVEAIKEGLADSAAGRVRPAETVFAELRTRFQAMADQR